MMKYSDLGKNSLTSEASTAAGLSLVSPPALEPPTVAPLNRRGNHRRTKSTHPDELTKMFSAVQVAPENDSKTPDEEVKVARRHHTMSGSFTEGHQVPINYAAPVHDVIEEVDEGPTEVQCKSMTQVSQSRKEAVAKKY